MFSGLVNFLFGGEGRQHAQGASGPIVHEENVPEPVGSFLSDDCMLTDAEDEDKENASKSMDFETKEDEGWMLINVAEENGLYPEGAERPVRKPSIEYMMMVKEMNRILESCLDEEMEQVEKVETMDSDQFLGESSQIRMEEEQVKEHLEEMPELVVDQPCSESMKVKSKPGLESPCLEVMQRKSKQRSRKSRVKMIQKKAKEESKLHAEVTQKRLKKESKVPKLPLLQELRIPLKYGEAIQQKVKLESRGMVLDSEVMLKKVKLDSVESQPRLQIIPEKGEQAKDVEILQKTKESESKVAKPSAQIVPKVPEQKSSEVQSQIEISQKKTNRKEKKSRPCTVVVQEKVKQKSERRVEPRQKETGQENLKSHPLAEVVDNNQGKVGPLTYADVVKGRGKEKLTKPEPQLKKTDQKKLTPEAGKSGGFAETQKKKDSESHRTKSSEAQETSFFIEEIPQECMKLRLMQAQVDAQIRSEGILQLRLKCIPLEKYAKVEKFLLQSLIESSRTAQLMMAKYLKDNWERLSRTSPTLSKHIRGVHKQYVCERHLSGRDSAVLFCCRQSNCSSRSILRDLPFPVSHALESASNLPLEAFESFLTPMNVCAQCYIGNCYRQECVKDNPSLYAKDFPSINCLATQEGVKMMMEHEVNSTQPAPEPKEIVRLPQPHESFQQTLLSKADALDCIEIAKPQQKARELKIRKYLAPSFLERQNKMKLYEGKAKKNRRKDLWRCHSGANNNRKCC